MLESLLHKISGLSSYFRKHLRTTASEKKKTERKKWQEEPVLKHRVKSRLYVEYVIYPNIDYGIYC